MAETYVALSARDLDDAMLRASGQPIPVQHEPLLYEFVQDLMKEVEEDYY